MKDIVIITAHCETQEKIDILIECINEVKSQGYPIILSTHIQIPNDIYDMVDYVVYDKENPVIYNHEFSEYLGSTAWLWAAYSGFYQEYTLDFNHGYAVLKLIKNGVGIAKMNGYDISHVVCYDYILYDKNLLKNQKDTLIDYDVYSYEFKGYSGVSAALFSFRNDKFIETFSSINSKTDYSNCGEAIFEKFLEKQLLEKQSKIFKRDIDEIRSDNIIDKIGVSNGNLTNNLISKDDKSVALLFLSKIDENYYIYFIRISDDTLTLKISINDSKYQINSDFYKSNLVPITNEQLESGIKVEIPELEILDVYNLESRYSNGRIDDMNIIVNLEDIEI